MGNIWIIFFRNDKKVVHISITIYSGTGNIVLHHKLLIGSSDNFGNPFKDKKVNLINIVSREVSHRNVSQEADKVFNVGKKQGLIQVSKFKVLQTSICGCWHYWCFSFGANTTIRTYGKYCDNKITDKIKTLLQNIFNTVFDIYQRSFHQMEAREVRRKGDGVRPNALVYTKSKKH